MAQENKEETEKIDSNIKDKNDESLKGSHGYSSVDLKQYTTYHGYCDASLIEDIHNNHGSKKWFTKNGEALTKTCLDSIKNKTAQASQSNDLINNLSMGVTFGGALKERLMYPIPFKYNYDIMLRIVRGEKLFINGILTSHEYLFNLFIKTGYNSQDIADTILQTFKILSKHDDSSLLMMPTNTLEATVEEISEHASEEQKEQQLAKTKKLQRKKPQYHKTDDLPFEHKVCHRDGSVSKQLLNALEVISSKKTETSDEMGIIDKEIKKIEERMNNKYKVGLYFGIPMIEDLKRWDNDGYDVYLTFARDDMFEYQATYLRKKTFDNINESEKEKERIYNSLYKYPRSADDIFGHNKVPKGRPRQGSQFLSVLSSVSTTKTTQVDS